MTTCAPAPHDRWTVAGLAFLAVALPLVPFRYLVLPGEASAGLLLQHLPTVVCLLLGVLWLWRCRAALFQAIGQIPLGWPVVVLLLIGLVSSVGAGHAGASLARTGYYFITGGLVFLVLVHQVRQPPRARLLLWVLLAAGYVVALLGVYEFVAGGGPLQASFDPAGEPYRRFAPDPWFERRIVSTIGHPVALGAYLALLLPVSLAAVGVTRRPGYRWLLAAGTVGLLVALLLTFSRGAWAAAVVAIAVYLCLRGRRYLLLLPVGLGVVAAVTLSVAGVSDLARQRGRDAYQSYVGDFGSTTRGAAYGYTSVIANRYPLTGLGAGMYRFAAYEFRRELPLPTPVGVLDTPDNAYLMALAETGAVGLAAMVYLLLALFRQLWPTARAPEMAWPGQRELARGFIAAFAGLLVNMLTVDALHLPVSRTLFWLAAGLAVVLAGPTGAASTTPADVVEPGAD